MFKIKIRTSRLKMTPEILMAIHKALGAALDRFLKTVRHAEVALLDVNGPRGGVDKQCKVRVHVGSGRIVTVTSTKRTLLDAVQDACDRVGHSLSRKLGRQKTKRWDAAII